MLCRITTALAVIAVVATATASTPNAPSTPESSTQLTTHADRVHSSQTLRAAKISALEAGLPKAWCGSESNKDQTVNATGNEHSKFKIYYVHASNETNRFVEVANLIQHGLATIHAYLLDVTAGQRTISLDLGTSCGSSYADITSITVPGSAASYRRFDGTVDQSKVMNALQLLAAQISGPPRHHMFILDQFEEQTYLSGLAQTAVDDRPTADNANNNPGLVGYVATPEGSVTQLVNENFPRILLHEMTHTMGAVQGSAPNSTSAGHCTDGLDVMCYVDGSPEGANYSDSVCPANGFVGIGQPFDCNNDDYFHPAPPSGSYLATHWNVFNSDYLVRCVDADPYCISTPSSVPTPDNPAARTVVNKLYSYKKSRRGKKIGTVTTIGAKEPGLPFVRNSVAMSRLKLAKGKWKITVCFRETGVRAVCETKTKMTSKKRYITMPRIYVTTDAGVSYSWGTVSVKPVTRSLKKRRLEVRTQKSPARYSLNF